MKTLARVPPPRAAVAAAIALSLALLAACGSLKPQASPAAPAQYALAPAAATAPLAVASASAPTLVVAPTRAAAGFDSPRIVYVRQPQQIEHFAQNEWVDTPARMLTPMIVSALETSGAFRAVVIAASSASGELRLDTEVLRLQHEFFERPSRVRFGLRAALVREATREVVATQTFEVLVDAASDDPVAGVAAASEAARQLLERLAAFCAAAAVGSASPTTRAAR